MPDLKTPEDLAPQITHTVHAVRAHRHAPARILPRLPGDDASGSVTAARRTLRQIAESLQLPIVTYPKTLTMALRFMDGGRARFLELCQLAAFAHDPAAITFLTVFSELTPAQQLRISIDEVCVSGGVNAIDLLKALVGAAYEAGVETANMVAAVAHPEVVAASVRSAKRINSEIGWRDRELLLKHHGFVPIPKGTTVNIGVTANAQAASVAAATSEPSVPSFLADVSAMTAPRRHVQQTIIDALPVGDRPTGAAGIGPDDDDDVDDGDAE